ncbi:universal stress protein [Marinobacterium zhoushanense]|uniref:Universal stress protein n=1 Tax=Marinobacterium zhoushanense TaxID=1679163 RepID=A0ABQ1K2J2_9GAMM|nr:universal stress protein [Marinobacterium zhoushanense]GGB84201.1 universal stress protein [Marinobacterium zhoushanense]
MLPDVKKILYASDLEKGARPAFRRAVSLCGHYHSEITYLHVIESLPASAQNQLRNILDEEEIEGCQREGIENLQRKVKERIERFCESELEGNEIMDPSQVTARVEEGTPWRVILKVADEIDADVIVMGVRHHTAMEKFLLGSTPNRVMYNSKRPVLIVPLTGED